MSRIRDDFHAWQKKFYYPIAGNDDKAIKVSTAKLTEFLAGRKIDYAEADHRDYMELILQSADIIKRHKYLHATELNQPTDSRVILFHDAPFNDDEIYIIAELLDYGAEIDSDKPKPVPNYFAEVHMVAIVEVNADKASDVEQIVRNTQLIDEDNITDLPSLEIEDIQPIVPAGFKEAVKRWHDNTDHLSSPTQIANDAFYQAIIKAGKVNLPYILQELRQNGGMWYKALREITGEDPVSKEDHGDVKKMNIAWLRWGQEKGYIVYKGYI